MIAHASNRDIPKSPCDVCQKPILKLDGLVAGADIRLLSASAIFDAVARQCFVQHDYALPACVDTREQLEELRRSVEGVGYRRTLLASAPPKSDVYLLAHNGCIPRIADLEPRIKLEGFVLPIEFEQWDEAVREFNRYNEKGWALTVQKVFGRRSVYSNGRHTS